MNEGMAMLSTVFICAYCLILCSVLFFYHFFVRIEYECFYVEKSL